ncbi:hypothetical protein [Nitrincola tapanii]|uniref:Uncharacterized protein n=1 Tax=Nitrincola tapanii TaxID=1708751 RepID=A0A5A9W6H9_9GAMM|nr:hypothetical protein [Nitrincola tapanii]KAA0875141.1 hypothetical protein E1H14_06895 [Nitrincola tapanii]
MPVLSNQGPSLLGVLLDTHQRAWARQVRRSSLWVVGIYLLLSSSFVSSQENLNAGYRFLATPSVLQQGAGEVLNAYIPANWHTLHRGWEDQRGLEEWAPLGQTLLNWREMLAFQLLEGVQMQPAAYLRQQAEHLSRHCHFSAFHSLPVQTSSALQAPNYPSAMQASWCGQVEGAPWGEILLTRVVQGERTLYILSKSWRTIPFTSVVGIGLPESEIQLWSETLSRSFLCDSNLNNCPF